MRKSILSILFLILISCNISTKKDLLENTTTSETFKKEMNTLGLIGGTSWHSTLIYYSIINQSVNDHFGNNTNPPLLVYTLNQAKVHQFQKENRWGSIDSMLTEGALSLKRAGAESILFCANTPHKVFNAVQEKLDFPIIHIADATAHAIHDKKIKKVCFIGTKYSMEEDFITKRIVDNGIDVLVPEEKAVVNELHRIIIEELTYGEVNEKSKKYVLDILNDLIDKGAEGVILGCTEFPLMIMQEDLNVPIFNTTEIHAKSGVDFILNKK